MFKSFSKPTILSTLCLFLGFTLSSTLWGQLPIEKITENWSILTVEGPVQIEAKKVDCINPNSGIDKQEIYLKFTNLSNQAIDFTWEYDLTYDDVCYNCDGNNSEMQQTIHLAPKSSIGGECGVRTKTKLSLFVKF